ncbi:MAG TPA: hypothetical protein VGD07_07895 [Methylomirabilota bacterium]|jgi:hypothetical protein
MQSKSQAKNRKPKKVGDLPAGDKQAAGVRGGFDPVNDVKIGTPSKMDPVNGVRLR